ncbi:hypothetical protein CW670_11790 [Macrococcoides caseolyticum]|uniref:hypothetical protein n=1 Tax=Macrococcoides caseolyticum TaxID=69966 RepID=UPI000C336E2D|nr:hypothetical protein [Macrococcus caseolyticus]PKE34879.1 hypothetical protein CW695_11350 [Macrococcus caseolyticus]PKE73489.1 hypothetical protein CW670_11790 [Macrococcus caseolyticus]
MSQAEEIREIVYDWLHPDGERSDRPYLKEIMINNEKVLGIKYKDLKNSLLKIGNFTEGAVVGALRTLPNREESISKVKTKEGVFYYFVQNNNAENFKQKINITDSKEYEDLLAKTISLNEDVGKILRNASNDLYHTDDMDIEYLRIMLRLSGELKDRLEQYRVEKAINRIKSNNDWLPF